MLKRRVIGQVLLIIGLVFLLTACGSGDATTEAPPPTVDNSAETVATAEPTTAETVASSESTSSIAGLSDGQRLLAWVAPAAAPGKQGASAAGEVVFFDADGSIETILSLPNGTTRVTACGPNAESPDGSTFSFIATVTSGGVERGTVYLVHNANSEMTVVAQDMNPANCIGSAPFQYSPDSSRFAYIDWPDDATNMTSPFGRFHIFNTADADEIANIENVTAFSLNDTGAAFVSFFTNADGEATEVAISTWNGSSESEVASLTADSENRCFYTSSSLSKVSSGLLAIMGYKCNRGGNTNTQWQFYLIDTENGTAQLEKSANSGGRYFAFSNTNAVFVAPDGNSAIFSVPDGVNSQSVSLLATSLDDVSPAIVLDRFGLMISVSDKPYDANNATAITSSDGRWLAIVVNDGNNNAVLQVFDLNDVNLPPIKVDAANQGDTIASMVFAPDNSTLYYVSGGDEGDNNSLFGLDLTTGAESRMSRGRYAQMLVSPDGNTLAIMNWVEFNSEEPRYLTLEMYDLAAKSATVIDEGGVVNAEGKLENPSFAYPLSWRN
jgi:hypothetical protein